MEDSGIVSVFAAFWQGDIDGISLSLPGSDFRQFSGTRVAGKLVMQNGYINGETIRLDGAVRLAPK